MRMQLMKYLVDRNIDVDQTADLAVAGKSVFFGFYFYNNAAATRYIKYYDKATAATVGTDTPKLTFPVPAASGAVVEIQGGIEFALGISVGASTGVADNDTGAPAANDVVVNTFYL